MPGLPNERPADEASEQTEPVERRVALKIIKPGMDTRQVIARFEAERQALAMMDHPNIAKVLDAGTTASGQPYFVMELVEGRPITEYCAENHLATDEVLRLFLGVIGNVPQLLAAADRCLFGSWASGGQVKSIEIY